MGPDLLQHLAAFSHQDGLLAVAVAKDGRGDARQCLPFLVLLHHHRNRVRHLFPHLHQNMFADQLRRHEAQRLIGDLVLGELRRSLGQRLEDALQQFVEARLLQSGNRNDLLKIAQRLKLRDERKQVALVGQQVNFVEEQKHRRRSLLDQIEEERIGGVPLLLGIDDHQDQIASRHRLAHIRHHLAAERGVRAMHSGRVNQHNLPRIAAFLFGNIDDPEDAVARRLRLGRDDGELLPDQRIQQRALARVGPAKDTNESGVKGHGDRLTATGFRPPIDQENCYDLIVGTGVFAREYQSDSRAGTNR